jgi:hypothetical protein
MLAMLQDDLRGPAVARRRFAGRIRFLAQPTIWSRSKRSRASSTVKPQTEGGAPQGLLALVGRAALGCGDRRRAVLFLLEAGGDVCAQQDRADAIRRPDAPDWECARLLEAGADLERARRRG